VTDLVDVVPSLRNVIARPGTFATLFPETTEADLVDVLRDGLAECHLEGILLDHTSDEFGLVDPDLDSGQAAMVLLFAGARLVRAELLNRASHKKYVAGPVSFEEDQSAQILKDILAGMAEQKTRMIATWSQTSAAGSIFAMADAYVVRSMENGLAYGFTGDYLGQW
jgi:hypothetical protein